MKKTHSAEVSRTEIMISKLLRLGVLSSAILTLAGGALFLVKHSFDAADYTVFRGAGHQLRSVPGVLSSALSLDAGGIIQAGVLLLLATPIARVVLSAFVFLEERDHVYVAVTLIVLAMLMYSLLFGGF